MKSDFASIISILQLVGVIAIFISTAILIIKVIAYKDNVDKRALFMEGSTKLLIGVIIIGSIGLIVSMLYGYLLALNKGVSGTNLQKANLDLQAMLKAPDGSESFLGKMLGGLAQSIATLMTKVFGLTPIDKLITPEQVTIFNENQWGILQACYILLTFPAVVLLAVMVFKTGIGFLRGSMNTKEAEQAKEDLLRWFYVIIFLAGGFLLCKAIVGGANFLTQYLNNSLKTLIPSLDFNSFINNDQEGLFNGIVALYFAWITLKVNVLFIVRDITLAIFIVFTPLAITLWGINKGINAFGIWLGEILSNAFMAFFLSVTFIIFSALLITIPTTNNQQLLFIVVGLSLVLKVASVLRNSLQNFLTKMSGLNEDDTARKFSLGGMAASALGVANDVRNAKRLGQMAVNGGKSAIENIKSAGSKVAQTNPEDMAVKGASAIVNTLDGFNSDDFNSGNVNSNDSDKNGLFGRSALDSSINRNRNKNISASAKDASRQLKENARNRGQSFNSDSLEGFGPNGSLQKLNDDAIKANFLDNLATNSENNLTEPTKANTLAAANDTIDKIAEKMKNDSQITPPAILSEGKTEEEAKAAKDQWYRAMAENQFNNSVFGADAHTFNKDETLNPSSIADSYDEKNNGIMSKDLAKNLNSLATNSSAGYSSIIEHSKSADTDYNYTNAGNQMNSQFNKDLSNYSSGNSTTSRNTTPSSSSPSSSQPITNNSEKSPVNSNYSSQSTSSVKPSNNPNISGGVRESKGSNSSPMNSNKSNNSVKFNSKDKLDK